ncbi:MAG TPA: STAS domain-containing protein [Candidatus Lustribacter sp.]|jgi:anti-sigma B factor antagonist|nr:STAS domain-containing protein [Candidatus Lustribacter sp.]
MEQPTVLTIDAPRLDYANADAFGERLSQALGDDGSKHVIVNFHGVEAISSVGFRALVLGLKKSTAGNGAIVVTGLSGLAREAYLVSKLDLAFHTFETLELAQTAFRAGEIQAKPHPHPH